jgi:hypothetical protein
MKSDAQVSIGVGAEVKSPGSGPRGFKSSSGRELAAAQNLLPERFHMGLKQKPFRHFCVVAFSNENPDSTFPENAAVARRKQATAQNLSFPC